MTERRFQCVGVETRHDKQDILGYIAESKAEALAECQRLHPTFDVWFVREVIED